MHVATDFRTVQRVFLGIGAVALAASAFMTWKFGHSISVVHGMALVSVTMAAAFVFPAARFIREAGMPGAARAVAVVGAFFVCLEFVSDLGYTFGMRDKQVVEEGAKSVAYKATQDVVGDERTNLAMWRKQLSDLEAQNAWATTVTADGLRAQLANATLAIDLESKRGGCKEKCLARTKDRDDINSKIATAEKVADLGKRIEATQRVLDGKTVTAVATKTGHSTTAAQSKAFGRIGLMLTGNDAKDSLNPDETSLTIADMSIGLMMALGATALPTLCFYIGFFGAPLPPASGNQAGDPAEPMPGTPLASAPQPNRNPGHYPMQPMVIHTREQAPAAPTVIHTRETVLDEALKRWARSGEVRQLTAA